jgi:hypothetical protein
LCFDGGLDFVVDLDESGDVVVILVVDPDEGDDVVDFPAFLDVAEFLEAGDL